MAALSEREIAVAMTQHPAWRREGEWIVRDLVFSDFGQAIAFVNRVAEAAERANHHPDILLHAYKRVRVSLTTHAQGGLTQADFRLAGEFDALAAELG